MMPAGKNPANVWKQCVMLRQSTNSGHDATCVPPFADRVSSATILSTSVYGNGRISIAYSTLNTATEMPMLKARVAITVAPNPGALKTMISGIGVFYPDRKPTQRIGIKPDVEAKPTITGIVARRDEVLEAALREILGSNVPVGEIEEMAKS